MNGGGGWDGGSRAQMQQSNFPSLQPASSQAGVQAGSAAARDASSSARPPPLVKKTAKCPCGRRVSHFAMEEGQEVPSLECDAGEYHTQGASRTRLSVWHLVLHLGRGNGQAPAPCMHASFRGLLNA
jgi:hypothetical protein